MKLLILTQVVDTDDPVLGFFVRWIEELAKHYEHIEVICLKEGEYVLPTNVHVQSLGKENHVSRASYVLNFYRYVWTSRNNYDTVFVHMNQEYVLLAGWLWKMLGKRVYLWRNHYAGSWLTGIAVAFCTKVFCTSKYSYTAKYKKTMLMPVGVDTERFRPDERIARKPRSILFFSRMSPSKRPEMLINALYVLAREGKEFTATFVGSPLSQDEKYYEDLKAKVHSLCLSEKITFLPAVSNSQAPDLYRTHEIFINTSPSGMLDKTIFEAAACGCVVLASSQDWKDLVGEQSFFDDTRTLASSLAAALGAARESEANTQEAAVSKQSLKVLVRHLADL